MWTQLTFHAKVHWACIKKLAKRYGASEQAIAGQVAKYQARTGEPPHKALAMVREVLDLLAKLDKHGHGPL